MFVAYYRVSTQQQGRSGLGLEAQRQAVTAYLARTGGHLVDEFTEVETGKGSNALDRRPMLRNALDRCAAQKAVLIIAKLDRLARNVHFVTGLIESRVEFVAADMPEANKTMIQMHAVMAEWERDQISKRTKAALAAAKANGVKLGECGPANLKSQNAARRVEAIQFANRLRDQLASYKSRGLSQRQMVESLNALRVPTRQGGKWSLVQLQRVVKALALPEGTFAA
jgi:DNA invertase Pin-like site-specific DNA recombinase